MGKLFGAKQSGEPLSLEKGSLAERDTHTTYMGGNLLLIG